MNRNITSALLILATVFFCTISRSCANTTTPPSGGLKDTLPPVIVKTIPENNATNFPVAGGKITFVFNEYSVVKDANQIYLSPPTRKRLKNKVKGRNLEITFQDTLQENTTYTLDLGSAIADNNEGNIALKYVYTFSTGSYIDSMYVTGTVMDCEKLTPVKNALVALYTDPADSACINSLPVAATRTDEWGFFAIRNIKPIQYYVYTYSDENFDSKYNPESETVGFMDRQFIPTKVMRDSIYELRSFNMKDTVACEARKGDLSLLTFKEYYATQFIKNSGRLTPKQGFITFSAPNADVNLFTIFGIKPSSIIRRFTPQRDSMTFWIDSDAVLPDSLLVTINYFKSDSLGNMVPEDEHLSLALDKELVAKMSTPEWAESAKADTLAKMTLTCTGETVEQEGIQIEFEDPLRHCYADSLRVTVINTKNQEDTISVKLVQDSLEMRKYRVETGLTYESGSKYQLHIPAKSFYDIYGRWNKEENVEFSLPNTDQTSSITLNVTGIKRSRYIIELVDSNKSNVFRKYTVTSDCELLFPYLKEGEYSFRITEDRNGNGIFDTGSLMMREQPEKVILFKLPDGTDVIKIEGQMDIIQDLNIN